MDYVGNIFRPPSEAGSLLLQVTVGCSHNRCTYCGMYRDKRFRPKPAERVEADLLSAARLGPVTRRAFLCDGDAMILGTRRLLEILGGVRRHLPWIERVGVYGDTRGVNSKSPDELRALREAGLGIVYHGMESGDDEVLEAIDKGGTRAEAIETARRLRQAGITHSVMVLLGVGGVALTDRHARATASALTEMDPRYVGALTTTVLDGTPMGDAQARGDFRLPDKFGLLAELRTMVAESELTGCRLSSNHASNYLPLRADLPADKAAIVAVLDRVLAERDERYLRPEYMRAL